MMKSQKEFKDQAIPFILINEKIEDNKVTYQFQLQRKAVDIFMGIKNKKIAVATVAGPQRSGKSFLSNRLLKRMKGFAIGPSTMPCTKGLWIWGAPIQISQDTVLIIMDTQGLNSSEIQMWIQKSFRYQYCYPQYLYIIRHIDQKALENMSYVLRISQNLRMKSQNEGDSEISKFFPYFYWVLRDFSLDLKGMSQNQYLQNALKPVSNDEKDPKNQIRSKIRKLFTFRRCQCFPRPINDQDQLAHIQSLKYEDLRQKFRQKMSQFQKTFFQTLPVKLINGKPLTADIYLNLVRQYIGTMNSGKVPEVLTSLQRVLQSEARQITQGLMNNYKDAMNKLMAQPLNQTDMLRNHTQFRIKIQIKIDQKLKNWLDIGRTGQYKKNLMDNLQKQYKERIKKNNSQCQKICISQYSKLFQGFYELPEMKNTELVSDSYLEQKYLEFTKKIKNFHDNCKAPKKYLFFIQKVPKALFQYFQLFFARIKGVYSNEMNKLQAQGRGKQLQVQSLRRINAEQENLLLQKQKQIQAITYQKDILKRQHEKNEKMKQFQKQTDKMSKNEMKKTLQSYKQHMIQLQNTNEQLQKQLQKMKTQLSTRKIQIQNIIKKTTTQNSQSTNPHTDIPNQFLFSLSSIKEKLNNMREFYEESISQESYNENWIKQIEDERTSKFTEIEKAKQKYNAKIGDLRQKFNKTQAEYQRNIKMMNDHIDDLKTQNIELQRQLNQNSDKKNYNSNSQRKNLQESIRLKQNNINSLKNLNVEKDKRINDLQMRYADLKAQKASLDSYRQTFPFILTETLNWANGKNNKLKHSLKTLSTEDEQAIRSIFKQLKLNPF